MNLHEKDIGSHSENCLWPLTKKGKKKSKPTTTRQRWRRTVLSVFIAKQLVFFEQVELFSKLKSHSPYSSGFDKPHFYFVRIYFAVYLTMDVCSCVATAPAYVLIFLFIFHLKRVQSSEVCHKRTLKTLFLLRCVFFIPLTHSFYLYYDEWFLSLSRSFSFWIILTWIFSYLHTPNKSEKMWFSTVI